MAGRRKERRTERSKIDATPPWETRVRSEPDATTGPFDERDRPDDGITRVELGALQVPAVPGLEVRLDLDEAQRVISATLATKDGTMQLGVFAAPRNEGIWDEVRAELAESLVTPRGAGVDQPDGPFGTELVGKLRAEGGQLVSVRFIGVDGPRWFLRAMLAGPVAADAKLAAPFEETLRGVVVVRGPDPLPVRDPVPLHLPPGIEVPGDGAEQQG